MNYKKKNEYIEHFKWSIYEFLTDLNPLLIEYMQCG